MKEEELKKKMNTEFAKELKALFKDCEFRYKQDAKTFIGRFIRQLDYNSWLKGFTAGQEETNKIIKGIKTKLSEIVEKENYKKK